MQKKDDLSRPYEEWAQDPAAVRRAAAKLQWLAKNPPWVGWGILLAAAIVLLALFVLNFLYSKTVFLFAYEILPMALLTALVMGVIIFILVVYAKIAKVIHLGWGTALSILPVSIAGILGFVLFGQIFVAHVWTDSTSRAVVGELVLVSNTVERRRGCAVRYHFLVQGQEGYGWCGSRPLKPGSYLVYIKVSAFGSLVSLPIIPFE